MEKKILVVEDDEFLRELYLDTLSAEGFKIESAKDGDEALQKIKVGNWDLVLLDIILPNISGIDIMKKLKAEDPNAKYTKSLVFLTNLDKGAEITEALSLGDGYLIKSQITPGDLVSEVKLYLSKTPASPTSKQPTN